MMASSSLRVLESNARAYRRTWKGTVVTAFVNPLLFLLAMGVVLGSLIDRSGNTGSLGGASYLDFVAPGLLAATAMQTGATESTWPVMAGYKWLKTYHAALATPVRVVDLVTGNLAWIGVRVLMSCAAFAVVTVIFGAISPLEGLVALVPALLTGLAFAAPITAYTASAPNEARLSSLFRFGIIPMFLFSGTFFPIQQLPEVLRPVAMVTPLWHGVELCRAIALGRSPELPAPLHVAYLLVLSGIGFVLAIRFLRKRLQP